MTRAPQELKPSDYQAALEAFMRFTAHRIKCGCGETFDAGWDMLDDKFYSPIISALMHCAAEPVDAGELDAAIAHIGEFRVKPFGCPKYIDLGILLEAAKAHRANLSNVTSDGWQPIETYLSAEDVDVWVGVRLVKCHLDRQWNRWYRWSDEGQRYYSFNEKPTHWQPIKPPSNPTTQAKGEV